MRQSCIIRPLAEAVVCFVPRDMAASCVYVGRCASGLARLIPTRLFFDWGASLVSVECANLGRPAGLTVIGATLLIPDANIYEVGVT